MTRVISVTLGDQVGVIPALPVTQKRRGARLAGLFADREPGTAIAHIPGLVRIHRTALAAGPMVIRPGASRSS